MKKVALLLTMLPLAVLADVVDFSPSVYHHYRYQRIGYEILPVTNGFDTLQSSEADTGMSQTVKQRKYDVLERVPDRKPHVVRIIFCLLFGIAICLMLCPPGRNWAKRRLSGKWFRWGVIAAGVVLILVVFALERWGNEKESRAEGSVGTDMPTDSVRSETVVDLDGQRVLKVEKKFETHYYHPGQGWKYPTELTDEEMSVLQKRIAELPHRLGEEIERQWMKGKDDGSEDHARAVVIEVLRNDAEFQSNSRGIPIELMIRRFFVVHEWNDWTDHYAFMCPQTFPWVKPKGRFADKIAALPTYLHEKIGVEWKRDAEDGSEAHAKAVIIGVSKGEDALRSAIDDIPLDLLVEHYFTTEKWYDLGHHSFTHPKTIKWKIPRNQ